VSQQDEKDRIEVFRGLEGVRRRPGMYVGSTTDGSGLRNLVWEVVGNVVDQHLMRAATELRVDVTSDSWVSVRDDGPGIRVDLDRATDRSVLETVFTALHAGATYDDHLPHVHLAAGAQGFGLAPVNALCTRLEVETTRDGVRWAQAYERGEPVTHVRRLGPTSAEGTSIRFQPDPEIFGSIAVDLTAIHEGLQQIAWLNPLLRVFFQDRRLPGRGGLRTWVEDVASKRGELQALYSTHQYADGVFVDLALGWTSDSSASLRSFVNVLETLSGTHVAGLWRGFADYARAAGASTRETARIRKALMPGLVAIVHVGLYAPRFGGPMRAQLESPAAGAAVRRVLQTDLPVAMLADQPLRTLMCDRLGIATATLDGKRS
jgi:DNA gyrase subunit B